MSKLKLPSIDTKFDEITESENWKIIESLYQKSNRISIFGNGGNLAVADHAAIDTSRLTDKLGLCPGSGILASSLINDKGHDEWLKKWVEITSRGLTREILSKSLFEATTRAPLNPDLSTSLGLQVLISPFDESSLS